MTCKVVRRNTKRGDFDGMLQKILHTNVWNAPFYYMTFANFFLLSISQKGVSYWTSFYYRIQLYIFKYLLIRQISES